MKHYSTGKIIMDFLFSQEIGVFLWFLGYFSYFSSHEWRLRLFKEKKLQFHITQIHVVWNRLLWRNNYLIEYQNQKIIRLNLSGLYCLMDQFSLK